jgi:hypothetical protein
VVRVNHIELRALDDDDLDAIFEMMRDREAIAMAAFTAEDPDDRAAFDAWIERQRADENVLSFVVTENGGFAGTIAAFTVDGDREVTYWIARHAWGRGVATAALRLLVSHEPIRPLFALSRRPQRRLHRGAGEGGLHRGLPQHRLRPGGRSRDRGDRVHARSRPRRAGRRLRLLGLAPP